MPTPPPARNLDDVKSSLLLAFNKAIKRVEETSSDDTIDRMSRLAAELAEKIVLVEREKALIDFLKTAQESGRDIEVDLDKRMIRSVASQATAKVKSL